MVNLVPVCEIKIRNYIGIRSRLMCECLSGTVRWVLTSDGVDFIKEDEAGLLGPGHLKQLTHHPGSLETKAVEESQRCHSLALKFRAISLSLSSGHSPLPRTSAPAQTRWLWWSRHPCGWLRLGRRGSSRYRVVRTAAHLWEARYPGWRTSRAGERDHVRALVNAKEREREELLRTRKVTRTHVEQRRLHHFSQLLNLLFTSTDIAVGHIRLLLHLPHKNSHIIINITKCMIGSVIERVSWCVRTCIMVTVGSILGGRGMWIWYLFLSTLG